MGVLACGALQQHHQGESQTREGAEVNGCKACDPKGREVVRVKADLCRACLHAVACVDDRTLRFGGMLESDANHLRTVEGGGAVLRRIGAECYDGAPTRDTFATEQRRKTFDELERIRDRARRAPVMRSRKW
jgi:hypothetical protein